MYTYIGTTTRFGPLDLFIFLLLYVPLSRCPVGFRPSRPIKADVIIINFCFFLSILYDAQRV